MRNRTLKSVISATILIIILVSNRTISNAQEYKVFIDPGHGGKDNGSAHNGYIEDDINLKIATSLKDKLKKEGISVEMSREKDIYVSLSERANKTNSSDSDIFISIHQNASLNKKASGIETYYQSEDSKKLANNIQKNIIDYSDGNDRGIKKGNLQVLRENKKPSVLLECGFISNDNEAYKLNTYDYQQKLVNGIASGIKSYLEMRHTNESKVVDNILNNAIVLSDKVNVMSDRGKKFEILGELSKGSKVEVIDTKYDWHKIKYENGYGYVSGVYVK